MIDECDFLVTALVGRAETKSASSAAGICSMNVQFKV
jgi:hypothetical protein